MNASDPLTFFVLVLMAGVVLVGFYFFLREIVADAIALADKRREAKEREDRKGGRRG